MRSVESSTMDQVVQRVRGLGFAEELRKEGEGEERSGRLEGFCGHLMQRFKGVTEICHVQDNGEETNFINYREVFDVLFQFWRIPRYRLRTNRSGTNEKIRVEVTKGRRFRTTLHMLKLTISLVASVVLIHNLLFSNLIPLSLPLSLFLYLNSL